MSFKVVGDSDSQAQVVLGIGAVIGQAGADIIRLKDADGELFRDGQVPAPTYLHREGISTAFNPCCRRENAIESVHAAKQ